MEDCRMHGWKCTCEAHRAEDRAQEGIEWGYGAGWKASAWLGRTSLMLTVTEWEACGTCRC